MVNLDELQNARVFIGWVLTGVAVAGIIGNALTLYIFRKQTEKAYKLQVAMAAHDLFYSVTAVVQMMHFTCGLLNNKLPNGEPDVLRTSHIFMLYTISLLFAFPGMFHNSSVLMVLFIAIDRVIAAAKPINYKVARARTKNFLYVSAVATSFVLGFGASLFDCFRMYLVTKTAPNNVTYYYVTNNNEYIDSTFVKFSEAFRVSLRVVAAFALLILCCVFVHLYLKLPSYTSDSEGEIAHRKMITYVFLAQAVLVSIRIGWTNVSFFLYTLYPAIQLNPDYAVSISCLTIYNTATFCINFLVYFCVSKDFRREFANCFPKLSKMLGCDSTHATVIPMSGESTWNVVSRPSLKPT